MVSSALAPFTRVLATLIWALPAGNDDTLKPRYKCLEDRDRRGPSTVEILNGVLYALFPLVAARDASRGYLRG
jgi:hypothetical protein